MHNLLGIVGLKTDIPGQIYAKEDEGTKMSGITITRNDRIPRQYGRSKSYDDGSINKASALALPHLATYQGMPMQDLDGYSKFEKLLEHRLKRRKSE